MSVRSPTEQDESFIWLGQPERQVECGLLASCLVQAGGASVTCPKVRRLYRWIIAQCRRERMGRNSAVFPHIAVIGHTARRGGKLFDQQHGDALAVRLTDDAQHLSARNGRESHRRCVEQQLTRTLADLSIASASDPRTSARCQTARASQ